MNEEKILPILIELTGIAAIGVGVGIELATKADVGWVVVTIGSCLVAIGGAIWGKFINGNGE